MKYGNHVNKAIHNEAFIEQLNLPDSDFPDWAVTVISYAALHYVDALLAKSFASSPRNHGERSSYIYRQQALRDNIRNDYEDLKNDGIEARYTDRIFTAQEINKHILPSLDRIKAYVGRHVEIREQDN